MRVIDLIAVALSALLVSCESSEPVRDMFDERLKRIQTHGYPTASLSTTPQVSQLGGGAAASFAGAAQNGSDSFVSSKGPPVSVETRSSGEKGFSLNLVDASVAAAAKSVLGDILQTTYVVDPRVKGTVTLQTSQPVSRDALIDIMESALAVNGAAIVRKGGTYQIVPASEAMLSTPAVTVPLSTPAGPGVRVQVVELRYIGAEEMKSILEPISRQGAILRTDKTRNLLMLAGTSSDLTAMRDAIATFDVDWMRGMSVALHPLKASQPEAVAKELTTIFGAEGGPGSNLIRFIPNERLNAVLVLTSRASYLARASGWIEKLDKLASANEEQLFVYNIQNRPAKELAQVLQAVLSKQESRASGANLVAPDLVAETLTTEKNAPVQPALSAASAYSEAGAVKTSIVADAENNALLISTTHREYERVKLLLRQLDVTPTQILIEAVIAEVTLNDQLKFGLRWFFESGNFRVGLSDIASGAATPTFPGFAWSFATSDVGVTLNALSSITDVNIVSAPTLTALNNQKATLQVGDQVPIVTQQSTSTVTGNSAVVSSIELKDTGVILKVLPRVNTSGRVMLDIEQEVSNVVRTTTSGIDSPTIQQRKLSTRVIVGDNESLALGGLIQQHNSLTRSQMPLLGKIPLLGNAFKNKEDRIAKTELIIFIKPRIVRDIWQAREVTAEFRQQLGFGSGLRKVRGGANELHQDVKRLAF
ncbi:type II secretion system secretin GspD [Agrobacterium tumefaciens]|nr:type II secretion system secretin GspD [Agrobacterium tumefaciens]NSZ57474.1 type II secretion system secretin GspD [Agrobacterium tumefaciens]